MLILKDSIKINKSPKQIDKWLDNFVDHYTAWHPDHVLAKWLEGKDFEVGSVLYAEEYLCGKLEKLRFKVTKMVPEKIIEYKMLFPHCIICNGGSLELKSVKGGTIFTATLSFKIFGRLSLLLTKKKECIQQHLKEEGINLKKLLEK